MKRALFFPAVILALLACVPGLAATNQDSANPNLEQAKADYRAYLQQLKVLSGQYRQITSDMKQVIQEEGVPVWDDSGMGGIKVANVTVEDVDGQTFGDTDIQDTGKNLIVKIDLPGLKKEELKVSIVENSVLRVSGRREDQNIGNWQNSSGQYYRSERRRGAFERQIKLPVPVSNAGTEARYDNGVLTVKVLKASAAAHETPIQVR